nr:MAG TPA: hypothetical protein [Caudoviricetes sp.]
MVSPSFFFSKFLTGPTSQNYGATVEATHAKKAKW